MLLVSFCFCPMYWRQVSCRELRCSWSSADRRCSNYIWVINDFTAHSGAPYLRGLMVSLSLLTFYFISRSNRMTCMFRVRRLRVLLKCCSWAWTASDSTWPPHYSVSGTNSSIRTSHSKYGVWQGPNLSLNVWHKRNYSDLTSWNAIAGPFVKGIHRSPQKEASDAKLWCFLYCQPE